MNIFSLITQMGGAGVVMFAGAVISAVGALISAGGALRASYEKAESEKALRQKSDQIADLNREIAESITGGDSFCYVQPLSWAGSRKIRFALVHQGKYPVYDLSIQITDIDRLKEIEWKSATMEDVLQRQTWLTVGNLAGGQARLLDFNVAPESDYKAYNFFLYARNGAITEMVRFSRHPEGWAMAFKVIHRNLTTGEEKTVKEDIAHNFPRDDSGNVDWNRL